MYRGCLKQDDGVSFLPSLQDPLQDCEGDLPVLPHQEQQALDDVLQHHTTVFSGKGIAAQVL